MAAFASADDVENAFRPLTDAELMTIGSKLTYASAIIRQRFRTIDARMGLATTDPSYVDPELVKAITVAAVVRHLQNPEGWRQESIEDFTRVRDNSLSTGSLYLTDVEVALLTPVLTARKAFTIRPGDPAATYAQQEQALAYQHAWREPYIVERRL